MSAVIANRKDDRRASLGAWRKVPPADARVLAEAAREGSCCNPFRLEDGSLVRCGSRYIEVCPSCAKLAFGDWSAILRSGVFDESAKDCTFVFLTCTAPSFGAVHRVPRGVEAALWCPCRRFHRPSDRDLAGTPLDYDTYDFAGAVRFNRDAGLLWDRTRRKLARLLPGVEFSKVWEMQARLLLHAHVLLRIPQGVPADAEKIAGTIMSIRAADKIDGRVWSWGEQSDVSVLTSGYRAGSLVDDAEMAQVIGYTVKAINYMGKSIGQSASSAGYKHVTAMHRAALAMRCSRCQPSDVKIGGPCGSPLHRRFGVRSSVITVSRPGASKTGWSYAALTRRAQREARRRYMVEHAGDQDSEAAYQQRMSTAEAAKEYLRTSATFRRPLG